jgi:3-oxoadipate enol-lactonase
MPFIAAGALATHYELRGPEGAPTILFANSLGTNFHVWDPQAAALAGRYRILRYDMRGHGLTDCPPAPEGFTIAELVADALALLDALGIAEAHLCGLSIGGMVAQGLAVRAPKRVRSLILCDTALAIGPPANWDQRIAAVRGGGVASIEAAVLARWFTPRFLAGRPVEARGMANMLTRTPAEGYIGACLALRAADFRRDSAAIRCPTLVVVGGQDLATPPALAEALAGVIPGATLRRLPDAAHIPTIEQPAALNEIIADFLAARR